MFSREHLLHFFHNDTSNIVKGFFLFQLHLPRETFSSNVTFYFQKYQIFFQAERKLGIII